MLIFVTKSKPLIALLICIFLYVVQGKILKNFEDTVLRYIWTYRRYKCYILEYKLFKAFANVGTEWSVHDRTCKYEKSRSKQVMNALWMGSTTIQLKFCSIRDVCFLISSSVCNIECVLLCAPICRGQCTLCKVDFDGALFYSFVCIASVSLCWRFRVHSGKYLCSHALPSPRVIHNVRDWVMVAVLALQTSVLQHWRQANDYWHRMEACLGRQCRRPSGWRPLPSFQWSDKKRMWATNGTM